MISDVRSRGARTLLTFLAIGLVSGFMSGLFGVGGGTVIVPLLVTFAVFGQKLASGTSGASIIVTAAVGVIAYASQGQVDWIAALLLAVGGVIGAPIGAQLLHRLSEATLRWFFVGFLVVVIVSLFFIVPDRDAGVPLNVWLGIALVALGVVTGILSGLIGVGGGIIVVPVLILLFGSSDLVAKGTSLLMMIPTTISGAIRNARNHNVDFVAAGVIAAATILTTPLGALVAGLVDPFVANMLFAAFLVVIGAQMAQKAIRARRTRED
ncbi:sulfite exporter TauE/SafE family protein [Microbacterium excoecariae]|uniref:sulfite exporter TauE/SafE family protein n=1 Tax=Microbacterium excoecariae TaxID=2715210 RepID=UPI00140D1FE1|nr:sulfite exporter TauE/SafE family protein [Microbacterium excoecariae]NHI17796.1 sulfite exporter TauE/SafE family protein [Microbacterium excoecariae]